MRWAFFRSLFVGVVLSPMAFGPGALAESSNIEEPTLRRILFSTGGVALFEYDAIVSGEKTLNLTVRLDQVDDVLRSLNIVDPAGPPNFARLAVRSPLAERFRDLPFGPDDLQSTESLLSALKGANISISGPSSIKGKVVSVAPETVALRETGTVLVRHRLSLLTDQGLRQVIVEDINTLTFEDPDVKEALQSALSALAQTREKETRTLSIDLAKGPRRTVHLAHVAEVPLWKSSYRLTLPKGAEAAGGDGLTGRLAGWATLENLSGRDWTDVHLTVMSGNPVTFRQNIYSPYRVDRPFIPVEVYGRVLPPTDQGAIMAVSQTGGGMMGSAAPESARVAPLPAMVARQGKTYADEKPRDQADYDYAATEDVSAAWANAAAPATEISSVTAQVLYTFPTPITLPNGQSLLVPLLDKPIPIRRVTHIIPSDRTIRPMAAVRITNDTASPLPPGPISLSQETVNGLSFLGDARLGVLPKGESRLLDFAVDNEVTVFVSDTSDRRVGGLTAANGVLTLRKIVQSTSTYRIRNAADEQRTLVLDHPKRSGWSLVTPADVDKVEETPSAHRLTLTIGPAAEISPRVVLERTESETLQAGRLDYRSLVQLTANAELTPTEREAVGKLSALAVKAAEAESEINRVETQLDQLSGTKGDVRESLKAVPRDSDLQKRYLSRLNELEDQTVALEKRRAKAQADLLDAQKELDKLVNGLTLP